MHMADALLSPAVGGTMIAVSAGLASYSAKRVQRELDDRRVPLMAVLGAFVFAAQMINFTIPGTGSSGHLGGGILLSILVGPWAAFLIMSSILIIQALFFADGGLLALGCNIFNLGFFPCFLAYPLIYKRFVGESPTPSRLFWGTTISATIGLQLGALGVVTETLLSGITALPFTTFLLFMQPIHLAIGILEGLVSASVILFIWKERPEIINCSNISIPSTGCFSKSILRGVLVIALLSAGTLSWFASSQPDGLEWSIEQIAGQTEHLSTSSGVHKALAALQERTAMLPDYNINNSKEKNETAWPTIDAGKSVAGIVGVLSTLVFIGIVGKGLRIIARRS